MPAQTLPGWHRETGTGRGYVNSTTGQRLSRRQYDKVAHAVAGVAPMEPTHKAKAIRGLRNYQRVVNQKKAEAEAKGAKVSKRSIRNARETKDHYRELTKPRGTRETEQAVNSRKRAALKALGYRKGIPDWVRPGDSQAFLAGKLQRSDYPRAVSATFA